MDLSATHGKKQDWDMDIKLSCRLWFLRPRWRKPLLSWLEEGDKPASKYRNHKLTHCNYNALMHNFDTWQSVWEFVGFSERHGKGRGVCNQDWTKSVSWVFFVQWKSRSWSHFQAILLYLTTGTYSYERDCPRDEKSPKINKWKWK